MRGAHAGCDLEEDRRRPGWAWRSSRKQAGHHCRYPAWKFERWFSQLYRPEDVALSSKRPPLGVRLTVDVEEIHAPRGTVWWARVRWHDPESGRRETIKRSHPTPEAADAWIAQMQNASRTGVDGTQTLAGYVTFIGDRWTRGIDPTSTYEPYSAGLRLRVVPTLGHIPVAMITAGLVDRAIDQWETEFGRSTIKNTVSALVLVLNEAVHDGIISRTEPVAARLAALSAARNRARLVTSLCPTSPSLSTWWPASWRLAMTSRGATWSRSSPHDRPPDQ